MLFSARLEWLSSWILVDDDKLWMHACMAWILLLKFSARLWLETWL
jgi:hypothetical protein